VQAQTNKYLKPFSTNHAAVLWGTFRLDWDRLLKGKLILFR